MNKIYPTAADALKGIVRDGQHGRAANIVNAVRTRFNKMHIVKWRVACVAPSITQTFKLFFSNTNPAIAGDATFQNVPIGIDQEPPADTSGGETSDSGATDSGGEGGRKTWSAAPSAGRAERAASAKVKPPGPFSAISRRAARISASRRLPWW